MQQKRNRIGAPTPRSMRAAGFAVRSRICSQRAAASIFGPVYLADLRTLPRQLRVRAARMVREIEANPQPDGVFKRAASPPFKTGTIVAIARWLAVRHAIGSGGLRFYRIQLVDP